MGALDKVIGYEGIKRELRQLLDMMKNRERYETLGAKMPRGLLISGDPGLGKSLMARCFMEELGWKSYTVRRNRPDGDFVRELDRVFQEAAENAPAVILLDDMDKFVVEYEGREEYVAVQAGIDAVAGKNVYVIATANDLRELPDSLLRSGRFDHKIKVEPPRGKDADQIIAYYLKQKAVGKSINSSDVAKMLRGGSCADLETVLNEAAIFAGFDNSEKIEMSHVVEAALRFEYGVLDGDDDCDNARLQRTAYHEAGHAVAHDLFREGSVGLVSIRPRRRGPGGFMRSCMEPESDVHHVLVSLAGAAAVELRFGTKDTGATHDFRRAQSRVRSAVGDDAASGFALLEDLHHNSEELLSRMEFATGVALERYMTMTRMLLAQNRDYLDAVARELMEKGTLLNSDMRRIRAAHTATLPRFASA